ncbi:hypothetical protein I4U23_015099 [Adineta vaga]|nr:hypothetical protein I4U23_015099 [Adineta vaga]
MFTLKQIEEAHSNVKTGHDYPRYVQNLKKLGMTRYEHFLKSGITVYYGTNDYKIGSSPTHEPIDISPNASPTGLKEIISKHQQGQTDFPTFSLQAAENGTDRWIVNLEAMVCTYYDQQGNEMYAEPIPEVTDN